MKMRYRIDVFTGATTDVESRVYAQFHGAPAGERVRISGRLRGPFCEHARTLAAEVAFRDLGPGPTALAEAVVPDPCSWSTDLPHWYEAEIEARVGGRVVGEHRGMVGIRRFATHGKSFVLEGKRWVIRGARRESVDPAPLAEWRGARMAMLVAKPSDELCEAASREGVMLLAELSELGDEGSEMWRLARWPAVGMLVLPEGYRQAVDVGELRPKNLILAQWSRGDVVVPNWIDAIVRDVSDSPIMDCNVTTTPVLVNRCAGKAMPLDEAREGCDDLQGDLASIGDFAGYLV